MTKEEILKKAINKAKKNGWKPAKMWQDILDGYEHEEYEVLNLSDYFYIFSHDFAKAFFGKEDKWKTTKCTCGGVDFHIAGHDAHKPNCDRPKAQRGYKFHLQQMVLEKDRIKYLEKHL